MTDELTLRDRANRLDWLLTPPDDIADAVDRHVRIDVTVSWLNDVKADIRNWLTDQAVAIEGQTGGRFSVPIPGLAKVARSAPQPKPFVQNDEVFARWYVETLLERDPDEEAPGHNAVQFDQYVLRGRSATCPSATLIAFLHEVAYIDGHKQGDTYTSAMLDVVAGLCESIVVEDAWAISDDLLDHLLSGKAHPMQPSGRPSVFVSADALMVIDRVTGEAVPGTAVQAPGNPTLAVTPDPGVRKSLRAELDDLLGTPVLER